MNQEDLMSLLVCPVCRGKLVPMMDGELKDGERMDGERMDGKLMEGLCCGTCAVVYPVRGNIPVMLPDKAVSKSAWDEGRREAEQCASS